ncbi:hypothetical protein COU61_03605 [Candidatus Pacearchaeota archaeon CG10_big_fil_rev_8_21_14_0_10_35_13]|nr:MAG: hypothetical protein COU61_03605 [Candidatus Pacearchaeota archaeon CG10_big_fil_rev_8_21_14_0_10_35_13]
MNTDKMIRIGLMRKTEINHGMITSILANIERNLHYLKNSKIDEYSSRIITTSYYDSLRNALEALILSEGLKTNKHEAITHYLKEKNEPRMASEFDKLRILRNKINYYGGEVSPQKTIEIKEKVTRMINELRNKHLRKFVK